MSWDVILFNSKQKIISLENLDEELLFPIDFNSILEEYFGDLTFDGDHREITGDDYSIEYYRSDAPASNMLFNLHGERALFELIRLAKKFDFQIFDTGIGQMLDLEHPERNGYQNFKDYLMHVLTKSNQRSET